MLYEKSPTWKQWFCEKNPGWKTCEPGYVTLETSFEAVEMPFAALEGAM